MDQIPKPALSLGLAGLLPFLASFLASLIGLWPVFMTSTALIYGVVILSFMGGAIWGFAATQDLDLWRWLGLSVAPALYGFAIAMFWPFSDGSACVALALGFAALLYVDREAQAAGLAPFWWMRLRILLTTLVVLCLLGISAL